MTVETTIINTDKQGVGKKVLTKYEPHTVSIVGVNALGVNINKVKSKSDNFLETDKGKKLMTKINKAKALEEVVPEKDLDLEVADDIEPEQVEELPVEATVVETEEVEPKDGTITPDEEVVPAKDVFEAPEDDVVEVEETIVITEDPPVVELEIGEGGEIEKAKSFTSTEMITAQTDILKGVHALVEKIHKAIPDAGLWEITDMVYSSIWKVEDAIWSAENSEWNDIYDEVYKEASSRVNKAKALKVAEDGSLEQKLKALESVDPALAVVFKTQMEEIAVSKAKALDAENETKAVIRSKALEKGAVDYKRIATEDNTTEAIVDAMATLEVSDKAVHTVIAKALNTASQITMGGELFADIGSSADAVYIGEAEYVEAKAKSLVDANGGEMAAAKATVRQTEDYIALYK